MATRQWTNGAATGDWDTAGNWNGGVPTNSDDAVFDGNYTNDSVNGASVTAPANLYIKNYSGNLGSSGTAIDFDTSTCGLIKHEGSGEAWFTTSGTGAITEAVCKTSTKTANAFNISDAIGTPIDDIYVNRGRINITGNTVTDLFVNYINSKEGDAVCYVQSGAVATNIYQGGGTLVYQGTTGPTSAYILGGLATFEDGAISTLFVGVGARAIYKAAGHTITIAHVFGTLDLTQNGVPITITNGNVGGRVISSDNVTWSNNPVLIGAGALITDITQASTQR